jgi:hypothetical protein
MLHPDLETTGDQLKKAFHKMCRAMIPTGTPNITPTVRKAREKMELIAQKTEEATGSRKDLFSCNDVEAVNANRDSEDDCLYDMIHQLEMEQLQQVLDE